MSIVVFMMGLWGILPYMTIWLAVPSINSPGDGSERLRRPRDGDKIEGNNQEAEMDRHPLATIKKLDPEFFEAVSQNRQRTFADGALSARDKFLIAMALDAVHGASGGVASLARQAVEKGATREQIMEALHVAGFIGGVGAVYTASFGLEEVFE
jgi:alkylhydroperoxidase/carboxymuconolactone decarboxylase family protein YurZ